MDVKEYILEGIVTSKWLQDYRVVISQY
jgi:hypothetical protein